MKNRILSLRTLIASCLFIAVVLPAGAATTTLNPTADAYVQQGNNAAINFGANTALNVATYSALPNQNYDSYLKFDTASVSSIVSAKLRFYAKATYSIGSVTGAAYAVSDTGWSETGITWNNKPARGGSLGQVTVNGTSNAWYEIDVTAYVQTEFNAGRKTVSLALHIPSSLANGIIAQSREGANPPQLVITDSTANTPPTVSVTSPANGASYTQPANIALTASATDSDGITQVEFLIDGAVVATDTTAPFEATWSNATTGSHQIVARATDSLGLAASSAAVSITVNAANTPPTVSVTSPADGASFTQPANIALTATATDSDGIAQIEFLIDGAVYATDTTAPYEATWSNATTGSHQIVARATDSLGLAASSAAASVTVNAPNPPPTVSLTSPADGASFNAPATIALAATASDDTGIAQVEFLADGVVVATDTTAPYEATWNNAPAGTHQIVARATDTGGQSTSSAPVSVSVNAAPAVSLASPANGSSYTQPANIALSATATDSDGIAQVEFLIDGAVFASDTTAPYEATWSNATVGSHQIVARATDALGAVASSTAVTVTVNVAGTATTLNPVADAYVYNQNPDSNYGTGSLLKLTNGNTLKHDSYLKFDTSSLPGIASARLRLNARLTDAGTIVGEIYPVAVTSWTETGITWNNKPALGAALGQMTVASTTAAWYEIDVTAYVQAEFNAGRKVISLGLHAPTLVAGNTMTVHSRENTNKPELVITQGVANTPPTVSVTSPASGAAFTTPANITLSATATDSDGIAQVEFLIDGTVYATDTAAPYETTWNNATVGSHQIVARATDSLGLAATSTAAAITVNPAPTTYYYLETDQLGTPRLASDAAGVTVWRWDNVDPFGNNMAEEDPDGNGQNVSINLRFPGQYFDKETNLHYNYFRDYDPTTGRYIESDPIGLEGGINTYAYVNANPTLLSDPRGLNPITAARAGYAIGQVVNAGLNYTLQATTGLMLGELIYEFINGSSELDAMSGRTESRGWLDNPDAKREHDEYKDRYNQPPPPDLDPCERLKWDLKREETLRNDMQAWDAKWVPRGAQDHIKAIQERTNRINKLKEKMKKMGCACP